MSNKEILLQAAKAAGYAPISTADGTVLIKGLSMTLVWDPFFYPEQVVKLIARCKIDITYGEGTVCATCRGVGHIERLPGDKSSDQRALVSAVVWAAALSMEVRG